jgi:two-component system cell cycle sensor histidine kinase/response regulator CckA
MPEMEGDELARRFAALHPDVPVLFMSGYAEERPALGPRRRFLAKPFTMGALIGTVDALVGRRPPRFA